MFVLSSICTICIVLDYFTATTVEALAFGFLPSPTSDAFHVGRRGPCQRFSYVRQPHSYCYSYERQCSSHRRKSGLYSTPFARRSSTRGKQSSMSDLPGRKGESSNVIYQKIVRPPSGMVDALLLGYLVEYLQEQFTLPDRLPMTYSIVTPSNSANREPIIELNSPLSPNPLLTALSVHIIGIYGDVSDDKRNDVNVINQDTAPNMAMVTVEKSSTTTGPEIQIPPMLANLFSDSERQIVRALDCGLDEFMLGLIRPNQKRRDTKIPLSELSYDSKLSLEENAISAAKILHDSVGIDTDARSKDKDRNGKAPLSKNIGFIDASITQRNGVNLVANATFSAVRKSTVDQNAAASVHRKNQRDAALQSMIHNTTSQPAPSMSSTASSKNVERGGLDFAVHAARIAQANRQLRQNTSVSSTDFAVQAALQVAASRRLNALQTNNTKSEKMSYSSGSIQASKVSDSYPSTLTSIPSLRSPMLDLRNSPTKEMGRRRAFMSTISTPKIFLRERNTSSTIPYQQRMKEKASTFFSDIAVNTSHPLGLQTVYPVVESAEERTFQTNRSINVIIQENATANDVDISTTVRDAPLAEEKEVIQATLNALNEVVESGKDLTPEELLDEVMRCGDDQDRQHQVGAGFVSGAFEKAKALLREQTKRREERIQLDPPRSASSPSLHELDPRNDFVAEHERFTSETISPSEELRRMFEAGEQLAVGRITTVINDKGTSSIRGRATTDQDIDELIESDKSVSRHVMLLDDELTELMVRINKSPGEETDGPYKNPLFDIFSGPEVYDQNVDPLTSVNWPGAFPRSKSIRLPKDLDEAVRQAKFAAHVLVNLREAESKDGSKTFSIGSRELTIQQVSNLRVVVEEAIEIGLIDDPFLLQEEESLLEMVLNEMIYQPEERMREIAYNYKDLLLSNNFVGLVRKRLNDMVDRELDALRSGIDNSLDLVHAREREVLGHLVVSAQLLLKEVQALGAELESQQLEVIRSICKVAMDPSHRTEEEVAMALTDAVRDMRPLFDDGFIAYLKYAVAEEEGRLARAGLLNDPEHTQWLYVLKIVQQGVHAEIAKGINRYLEHIWYVLRMETPVERRMLLEKLVDVMPTLDVRPFVQVVENIVGSLGDSVRGEFDGATTLGDMTNKLLQLRRDLKEILPPERLAKKSRDADEWVAKQKQRLLEQRNLTKQRLKAAQDTEHLDSTIESFGKSGEVERFE